MVRSKDIETPEPALIESCQTSLVGTRGVQMSKPSKSQHRLCPPGHRDVTALRVDVFEYFEVFLIKVLTHGIIFFSVFSQTQLVTAPLQVLPLCLNPSRGLYWLFHLALLQLMKAHSSSTPRSCSTEGP